MRFSRLFTTGLIAFGGIAFGPPAAAEELLAGAVMTGDGSTLEFRITGPDAENIIGGTLRLGEAEFTIAKRSRLGLIGAARFAEESGSGREFGEYAILSSSFSEQTAVGEPWVQASSYVGCDRDYNTFIAVYRVYGADAVNALGSTPYQVFTEEPEKADESTVYCLFSTPPTGAS